MTDTAPSSPWTPPADPAASSDAPTAPDPSAPGAVGAPADAAPTPDVAPAPYVAPAPVDDEQPEESRSSSFKAGEMVTHTYFDPYVGAGGEEVTRYGLVVVADDDGVQVAWVDNVTHPIPADELARA